METVDNGDEVNHLGTKSFTRLLEVKTYRKEKGRKKNRRWRETKKAANLIEDNCILLLVNLIFVLFHIFNIIFKIFHNEIE